MGWHLVKIDERRKEQPPSIDELRDPILKYLTTTQIGEVLKQLRSEARIEKQTSPRNSPLDIDPFTLAPGEPEATPGPAATTPSFDASARAPVSESREAAPQPAAPAARPAPAPAPTPPASGPVSESRQGASQ
jgi:peptidyl-prolyl cis-trans isomerase C